MIKLLIATPAYDGRVHVQYAVSLAETKQLLTKYGIPMFLRIHTTGSLLCAERNRLLEVFMQTDCTHILMIDSDLGWPPEKVVEILMRDLDVFAGCYPSRKEHAFLFRPVKNSDGSVDFDSEKGLIELETAPAGFMLIKREVIEKVRENNPDLYYCPSDQSHMTEEGKILSKGYALFKTEVIDQEFWGEDFVFCKKITDCGYKIWTDPTIVFDHAGSVAALTAILIPKKEIA